MNTIHISAKTLTAALKMCAKVSKSTIPVLGTARLRGTLLSSTDLDVSVHVSIGDYHGAGMLIPVKPVLELLKAMPKTANAELAYTGDDETATLTVNGIALPSFPLGDFPELPMPGITPYAIAAADFAETLNQVMPAVSTEASRYTLNGALMVVQGTELRMVATDGHRLHYRTHDVTDQTGGASFPASVVRVDALKIVQSLLKSEKTETAYFSRRATDPGATVQYAEFCIGGTTVISRLVAGQFPNYEAVMPKDNQTKAVMDTAMSILAVNQVIAQTKATDPGRRDAPHVDVAVNGDAVQLGMPGTVTGTLVTFRMNALYLLDILKTVSGRVTLAVKDNNSAVMFDDGEAKFVVMPIRMDVKK